MKERVAIIGGGIAGLTAGYLLNRKYDVTLFERSDRLGGNACTVTLPDGVPSDIGVMACLRQDYRKFFTILDELGIATVSGMGTSVSFHNLDSGGGLYLTPGVKGLLAQRFALLRPSRVGEIIGLLRGLRRAEALLDAGALEGLTLGEALARIPEVRGDGKLLLIGTFCVISSMRCDDVMDSPAPFFIRKLRFYSHLLPPKGLVLMRYLKDGTRSYVKALAAPFRDGVELNSRIRRVVRSGGKVHLVMEEGEQREFDRVVFACNADQALALLADPTEREAQLLGTWRYTEAPIVVHDDDTSLPPRALMPGYTLLHRDGGKFMESSVNFPLWLLPGVPGESRFLITQHQNFPIRKERVHFERVFRTPIYDFRSYATVGELPSLNGVRNTYYCGAHFGFGLHEDAVASAFEVARVLEGKC
jgi:predicted NAD/FAD-binding protein